MCHAFRAKVILYLMRTVFLLDITVACFSKLPSAWMSDEAAAIQPAPAALSVLLPLVSLKDPPSFEGAERAHLLSLEGSCKPPVKERFWTMVPNRLSSPSISFLTHKHTKKERKTDDNLNQSFTGLHPSDLLPDFLSTSCVILHTSTFSSCFPSWQPPFH